MVSQAQLTIVASVQLSMLSPVKLMRPRPGLLFTTELPITQGAACVPRGRRETAPKERHADFLILRKWVIFLSHDSILTNRKVQDESVDGENQTPKDENRASSANVPLPNHAWMNTRGEGHQFVHGANVRHFLSDHNLPTNIYDRVT